MSPEDAQVGHPAAHRLGLAGEIGAEDPPRTAARAQPGGEHPQQGRLTGSVGPFKQDRPARFDGEGDIGQDEVATVAPIEGA